MTGVRRRTMTAADSLWDRNNLNASRFNSKMGFLGFNGKIFNGLSAKYQQLAQGETATAMYEGNGREVVEKVKTVVVHSSVRAKAILAGGLLFLLLLVAGSGWEKQEVQIPTVEISNLEPQAKYLHLLVTAPQSSANTCRLLASAAANHYPTANLISYKDYYSSLNADDVNALGSNTLKVRSILDYFSTLDPERGEDVVVIPDHEGTVFQLRPDILLERFWESVRVGQARARLGMSNVDANVTKQKIVFGASKTCRVDVDDPAYYAVPQSILASNAYGSKTDKVVVKEAEPNLYVRERFIDTKFVMGEVNAIKVLYEKALHVMEADKEKRTEQDAISRIFGEQEYYRAMMRDSNATDWDRKSHSIGRFFGIGHDSPLAIHPTHRNVEFVNGTKYDFGIGLDYEGLLSSSTSDHKIMGFVSHNNTSNLNRLRKQFSVGASGNTALPSDISRSFPPFWSRTPLWDQPRWPRLGWKDIHLFTNLWTGTIPATFHTTTPPPPPSSSSSSSKESTNPSSSSTQIHQKNLWESTWFHPHLRRKLNDYVSFPDRRLATLRGNGTEVAYWSMWREKWAVRRTKKQREGEARQDGDEFVAWKEVCGEFWEEILSDGKGGWDTAVHDW